VISAGSVVYRGRRVEPSGIDILKQSKRDLRKLRWREVAIVFQSAMSVQNPVLRVRDQIVDVLKAHFGMSREGAQERAAKTEATGFTGTLLQAGDAVIELFSCGMPMQENFFNPTKKEPGLFHVGLCATDVTEGVKTLEMAGAKLVRNGFTDRPLLMDADGTPMEVVGLDARRKAS
jgi:hypothetical protein